MWINPLVVAVCKRQSSSSFLGISGVLDLSNHHDIRVASFNWETLHKIFMCESANTRCFLGISGLIILTFRVKIVLSPGGDISNFLIFRTSKECDVKKYLEKDCVFCNECCACAHRSAYCLSGGNSGAVTSCIGLSPKLYFR